MPSINIGIMTRSEATGKRRVPRSVVFLTLCLLLPVLAFGAIWVNYKKPWLMDDFRAGYTAGVDGELPSPGKDPCGQEMANRYGGEPSIRPVHYP